MSLTYADLDRIAEIRKELAEIDSELQRVKEFTGANNVLFGVRSMKFPHDEIWGELRDVDLIDRIIDAIAREPRLRRDELRSELNTLGVVID